MANENDASRDKTLLVGLADPGRIPGMDAKERTPGDKDGFKG
ncbi:hypothetical protein JMW78_00085 (plasmid) [Klebsiella pneumoniae]|nr:hypothetical protein JMW78_00085 [Klebsiella pneumoniae]